MLSLNPKPLISGAEKSDGHEMRLRPAHAHAAAAGLAPYKSALLAGTLVTEGANNVLMQGPGELKQGLRSIML